MPNRTPKIYMEKISQNHSVIYMYVDIQKNLCCEKKNNNNKNLKWNKLLSSIHSMFV